MTTLQECQALDAQDPLRPLRERFVLPDGVIYLDGNSLGASPRAAAARAAEIVQQEWGQGLIRSWNSAGWIELPLRLGDQFAPWIGAGPDEVVFTDTTSINLYKVLTAAARIVREDAPGRRKLISERSNFPTDLYIAQSVCQEYGLELVLLEPEEIAGALRDNVAICMLTHVTCTAPAPTSPWAAATSTSTAGPAHRPSCGRTRASSTASGSRSRAGSAMPSPSGSCPTTTRPRASSATCAAPSPWSAWACCSAGWTSTPRPSSSAAWPRCAPSRWR
jgi:hypothetical protein